MKNFTKRRFLAPLGAVTALALSSTASAEIVADATAKIDELKTAAESMGTPILGLVAAIALIGIIIMLVKRAR